MEKEKHTKVNKFFIPNFLFKIQINFLPSLMCGTLVSVEILDSYKCVV